MRRKRKAAEGSAGRGFRWTISLICTFFVVVILAARTGEAQWVINEVLADPHAEAALGDANGDGLRDASEDEFVEIVSIGKFAADISGWTLSDGVGVRHVFPPGTIVSDECAIVIFGGGIPTGAFGGALVQTASTGLLGLNNSGDTITLRDLSNTVRASYTYGAEGGNDQSLTRNPDITGSEPLILHSTADPVDGSLFSPGTRIDGTAFAGCEEEPTNTPTPPGGPTATPTETPPPPGNQWVINEILFDPPTDPVLGDANCDGTRDGTQDEFVEIVNISGSEVDISGWTIEDGIGLRHIFPPGTVIPHMCAVVVFGGGSPICSTFSGVTVQTASTGMLGLNNDGDTVTLLSGTQVMAMYTYGAEGVSDESLVRNPDIIGTEPLSAHSSADMVDGSLFSPGRMIDGTAFPGCPGSTSAGRQNWRLYR
jgi:hypothetical protein